MMPSIALQVWIRVHGLPEGVVVVQGYYGCQIAASIVERMGLYTYLPSAVCPVTNVPE